PSGGGGLGPRSSFEPAPLGPGFRLRSPPPRGRFSRPAARPPPTPQGLQTAEASVARLVWRSARSSGAVD
ncbi:MAG: hypothetical protein LBU12_07965, partial [Deltaproteobacteria bacterium]|nr:hypothetical protein [Deltaproteobacteria bacterium]